MPEKILHVLNRDGEAETFSEYLHVGHAGHFTLEVKKRPAAVARIDLRGRLDVKLALELPRLGADNAFGDRAFQPQWATNRKHPLANRQRIRLAHWHPGKL